MRRHVLAAALAALALAAPGTIRACSQCLCGSPTPAGYLLGSGEPGWSYGFEDQYLSKSNALDDGPGEESQREHRLAAFVLFRPDQRWSFRARAPYAFKLNTRSPLGEPDSEARSHGFGDADLQARLDVFSFEGLMERTGALALTGSVTLPTGSNEAMDDDGDRLDAHLQPGTGAAAWSIGIAMDHIEGRAALSASLLGRLNATNSHGYRYGNAALFNVGYARALSSEWQLAAELNGRIADFDLTGPDGRDPNTGGGVLFLTPSVRWTALAPLTVDLIVQLPVASRLNGIQSEKGTARLALSWSR